MLCFRRCCFASASSSAAASTPLILIILLLLLLLLPLLLLCRYATVEQLVADVRQVFRNAMVYNPPSNRVHEYAKQLSKCVLCVCDCVSICVCACGWYRVVESLHEAPSERPTTRCHPVCVCVCLCAVDT